jgi:DivIVA domain-containing protein
MAPSKPFPTDRAALIARIHDVQFTPTRFTAGYDERAVDNYLDAVMASLRPSSTAFTPARIRDEVFPQTRFKGGYRIEDVDEFRRLLADAIQLLQ